MPSLLIVHGTVSEDLQLSFFLNKKHYNDVAISDSHLDKPVRFQSTFYVQMLLCKIQDKGCS